jgi:hypothetical protein
MKAVSSHPRRWGLLVAAGIAALAVGGLVAVNAGTSSGAGQPDLNVFSLPPVQLPPFVAKHVAMSDTMDVGTIRLALQRNAKTDYVGKAQGGDAVCLLVYELNDPDGGASASSTCGSQGALLSHIVFIESIYHGGVPENVPHTDMMSVDAIVGNDVTSASVGGKTSAVSNNVVSIDNVPRTEYVDVSRADGSHFTVDLGPQNPPPLPLSPTVPKLKGKTLSAATRALAAGHYRIGALSRVYSKSVKKDRVISQQPSAGTALPSAAKVDLVVSRGPKR